jgi:hypothetical protein
MCEKCEKADESIKDLQARMARIPPPPERKSWHWKEHEALRSQIHAAQGQIPRLRWFLHGGATPSAGGRARKKDPKQIDLL